jgi:hypothetical protein
MRHNLLLNNLIKLLNNKLYMDNQPVGKTEAANLALTHRIFEANIDTSEYLTSTQLQHRLEISSPTIFHWKNSENPIPFVTVPRGTKRHYLLFPIIAVDLWLQKYRPNLIQKFRENSCVCRYCIKSESSNPVIESNNTVSEATL